MTPSSQRSAVAGLCWLFSKSILKKGRLNSRSIGNFEPILISLQLGM